MRKVFGLKYISYRLKELLYTDCENKNNPDMWTWEPNKPEKIRNLSKHLEREKKQTNYSVITNYKPKENKQEIVLVFSMGNLSHGIIKNLNLNEIKYFYFNFVDFVIKGKLEISFENSVAKKNLRIGQASLNLDDVKVVLWTPPKYPNPLLDFEMIPAKKGRHAFLLRKRWSQFLRDLKLLLPENAIWIPSHPLNGSQEWQNKIGELNLASRLGLNIPNTILTNDVYSLRKFTQSNSMNLFLREFSSPPFNFPVIPIDVSKLKLINFNHSPSCFQEVLLKKFEYRVIILFDNIYPCKIYSQDSELTKRDWRIHDDANVKWELSDLPVEICDKLIKLAKKLELNWCSIDLIQDSDDNYYFLEINRPGAHYWLDLFIGLDITREISKKIKTFITFE